MDDVRTTEEEWLQTLAGLPGWTPPLIPTVIVAPHPDDETLACGGLIVFLRRRGVPVRIVAVTDGEAAYPDGAGLATVRTEEQTAALAELGVTPDHIVRLQLRDSNLADDECALVQRLLSIVQSSWHVVAPWQHDWHPDHEACGRAAAQVASATGAALSSWFFWTWHRLRPEALDGVHLRRLALDQAALTAKQRAIAKHGSQLQHDSGQPILPPLLLGPVKRPFEVFATA